MSSYRYDPADLRRQWIRVGLAFALTLVFLAAGSQSTIVVIACISFSLVILAYAGDLVIKHYTDIATDEAGITLTTVIAWLSKRPLRTCRIAWQDLRELKLGFFPTRRDRETGWFQLTLRDPGKTIKIQSQLLRFDELLESVLQGAHASDALMSETTEHNLGYFRRKTPQGATR